jgi:GNAT superfamily N-acetyltransferase
MPPKDPLDIHIRPASPADFPTLRQIEFFAFETLRMAGAAHGPPQTSSDRELQTYYDAGFLLAAIAYDGEPVGYIGGYDAGQRLHIGEMDVHPHWQRQGIGRRMMLAILEQARKHHLLGATLTTDRLAPFNAAFYASLGFSILESTERSQRLDALLETEAAKGLDPDRRVAMQLEFQLG